MIQYTEIRKLTETSYLEYIGTYNTADLYRAH